MRSNYTTYFPVLRTENRTVTEKYSEDLRLLQQEFNPRFQDICKREAAINLFALPLDIMLKWIQQDLKSS
jgi:hypothetical protein